MQRRQGVELVDTVILRAVELVIVTYNTLMDGYYLRLEMDDRISVFAMMAHRGCPTDAISYSTLISGFRKIEKMNSAILSI